MSSQSLDPARPNSTSFVPGSQLSVLDVTSSIHRCSPFQLLLRPKSQSRVPPDEHKGLTLSDLESLDLDPGQTILFDPRLAFAIITIIAGKFESGNHSFATTPWTSILLLLNAPSRDTDSQTIDVILTHSRLSHDLRRRTRLFSNNSSLNFFP